MYYVYILMIAIVAVYVYKYVRKCTTSGIKLEILVYWCMQHVHSQLIFYVLEHIIEFCIKGYKFGILYLVR
nr:hypothetical protein Itr_chr04CG16930 [Ipomoea trifida]